MKFPKTGLMIIFLIGIYLLIILTSNKDAFLDNVKNINHYHLGLAISFWIISNFIRALRWHLFVKEIDNRLSFKVNTLYFFAGFAFIFTPARLGEIIKSTYMKRDYGISISKTAPIILMERFYEIIAIVIVLSVGVILTNFDVLIISIPIVVLGLMFIVLINKKLFTRIINKLSKIEKFKKFLPDPEESYDSAFKLINVKLSCVGISTSILVVILQTISVYFVIIGLGGIMDLSNLMVIFPLTNIISALTFIPAGIGIFEAGLIGFLVKFNLNYEMAITTAFLVRMIGTVLFGIIGIIFLKILSKQDSKKTNMN